MVLQIGDRVCRYDNGKFPGTIINIEDSKCVVVQVDHNGTGQLAHTKLLNHIKHARFDCCCICCSTRLFTVEHGDIGDYEYSSAYCVKCHIEYIK